MVDKIDVNGETFKLGDKVLLDGALGEIEDIVPGLGNAKIHLDTGEVGSVIPGPFGENRYDEIQKVE